MKWPPEIGSVINPVAMRAPIWIFKSFKLAIFFVAELWQEEIENHCEGMSRDVKGCKNP